MIIKNKRGQVIQSVFIWLFATFMYFIIGYDLVKGIVTDVFLVNNPTGLMYFFGAIIPFVPIGGLMYWGYTILDETNAPAQGGFEQ